MAKKRLNVWPWLWITLGVLYFFLPLVGTLIFSLRARRNELSLDAYANVFADSRFLQTFLFSLEMAVLTIVVSLLLIVRCICVRHGCGRWSSSSPCCRL
jgi:putative spermidine/putrescine transport system permease protein